MHSERKVFTGWVYITRAEDVAGCWVAHCLEYDIVSMGDSPQDALANVREAVGIALADDLNNDLDPSSRRAPDEEWAPLLSLFDRATQQVPVNALDRAPFKEFAAPIHVVLVKAEAVEFDPNVDTKVHAIALQDAA